MLNKILILGGVLLSFTLIVENSVIPGQAYIFLWYSKTGVLSILSIIIGIGIGYGIRGIFIGKEEYNSNDEFEY